MKKKQTTDMRHKQSVLFVGKGSIIISIILISSLSFTLGYFVGKKMNDGSEKHTVQLPFSEKPEYKESSPGNTLNGSEPHDTIPLSQPSPNSEPLQVTSNHQNQKVQKTAKKQQPARMKEQSHKNGQEDTKKHMTSSESIKYTIQVGAFKNAADADKLKEHLNKKGYNVYISLSATKDHEKIHKVRVGEFSTRKQAEIVALKIKKSETLNTFVTFR